MDQLQNSNNLLKLNESRNNIIDIISFSKQNEHHIDYVLCFENKDKEKICDEFLDQLEAFENITFEKVKIDDNSNDFYVLLSAPENRLLEEAEKCKIQFYLSNQNTNIDEFDDMINKLNLKFNVKLNYYLIIKCLQDIQNESLKISFIEKIVNKQNYVIDLKNEYIEEFNELLDENNDHQNKINQTDLNFIESIEKELIKTLKAVIKDQFELKISKNYKKICNYITNKLYEKLKKKLDESKDKRIRNYDQLKSFFNNLIDENLLDEFTNDIKKDLSRFLQINTESILFEKKILEIRNNFFLTPLLDDDHENGSKIKLYTEYIGSKRSLFCDPEKQLTTRIRSLLIDNILKNFIFEYEGKKLAGLNYMIEKKYINDMFILHDPSNRKRQIKKLVNIISKDKKSISLDDYISGHKLTNDSRSEINEKLSFVPYSSRDNDSFNLFDFQFLPLNKAKDYFGEEIGLYFAWVQHFYMYLILLSIIGIIFYVIGLSRM